MRPETDTDPGTTVGTGTQGTGAPRRTASVGTGTSRRTASVGKGASRRSPLLSMMPTTERKSIHAISYILMHKKWRFN